MEDVHTFCSEIYSPDWFGDSLEPASLYAFETAISIDVFFPAHISWAVVVAKCDTTTLADKYDTYEEEEKDKKESRQNNKKGEDK